MPVLVFGLVVVGGRASVSSLVTASKLRVGDCFDLPNDQPGAPADESRSIRVVPCTEPHHNEVFFVGALDYTPDRPTETAMRAWSQANCEPAFEQFVGTTVGRSSLTFRIIYPEDVAWATGETAARCALMDPDLKPLSGSMKGSMR